MIMSWINDNAIVGQESNVMDLKKALIYQFKCEDCRPMDEYLLIDFFDDSVKNNTSTQRPRVDAFLLTK